MKLNKNLIYLCLAVLSIACCKDDDSHVGDEFEYHVHIHAPGTAAKMIGDTLDIDVEFESHTGMTIHHINVRIYEKISGTELYSKPDDAHVHESDGAYAFTDTFVLSAANGVTPDVDLVLEAKVWGHDDGVAEVVEMVEFHVSL
jgi:hypothetical protein